MFRVEQVQELAPKQYGSRKDKAMNIQSLNKQLFYDIIRLKCQPTALCSNYTKSCYNRIVLLVMVLAMCWLGGTVNGLKSMVDTLATIKHHICVVFKDSKKGQNCTDWEEAIAGVGQGNDTGPHIWAQ